MRLFSAKSTVSKFVIVLLAFGFVTVWISPLKTQVSRLLSAPQPPKHDVSFASEVSEFEGSASRRDTTEFLSRLKATQGSIQQVDALEKKIDNGARNHADGGRSSPGSSINDPSKDPKTRALRLDRYNYHARKLRDIPNSTMCGQGPEFKNFFKLGKRSRSRNEEDWRIYNLFYADQTFVGTGTYIELGAYDGKKETNTAFFDACLGWEGLTIEANPAQYKNLVVNRPYAHRMQFAPSCSAEEEDKGKTVQFVSVAFTNAGLVSALTETIYSNASISKHTVDVPCGTLTTALLDVFPSGHVNFFSLDVEGAEPLVLQSIDFSRVKIDVVIVESFNQNCLRHAPCATRTASRKILTGAGYRMFEDVVYKSDLFVAPHMTLPSSTLINRVSKGIPR